MTDKEQIINYLNKIDVYLDSIVEEYEVSEDVREFLLSLSVGEIETLEEAQTKATELWRKL
jgi:hypothetical protein|nr:MAG TPA: hypothetical protein [Caudoviricetes sp.]